MAELRHSTGGTYAANDRLQAFKKNVSSNVRFHIFSSVRRGRQCALSRRWRAAPILVCCSALAISGRNDDPHVLPFAERSAANAFLPLQDGGPLRA